MTEEKLEYNSDFTDMIEDLNNELSISIRNDYNWWPIINGYTSNKNNEYFNSYRKNGKSFPMMFRISILNNWRFHTWSGDVFDAKDLAKTKDGGRVIFDDTIHITIAPELDRLDVNDFKGLYPEALEFESIKPIKLSYLLKQSTPERRAITAKDRSNIIGMIHEHLASFLDDMESAASKQISRRFEEFLSVDEEFALNHAPDSIKDIFIF